MPIKKINGLAGPVSDIPAENFTHSYDVQDIMNLKPGFIIRNGITIFLVVIVALVSVTWFIKYPDIVTAAGTLTSVNAPKEVIAGVDGKLVKLLASENRPVHQYEVLGFLESTARHEEVISLSDQLDTIAGLLHHDRTNEILRFPQTAYNNLGELQEAYQLYTQAFQDFSNYLSNGYYLQKMTMMRGDLSFLEKLHGSLTTQREILSQDLSIADSTYKANASLHKQQILSLFDIRAEKSKLLAKENSLSQMDASVTNNEYLKHSKLMEIAELENQIALQKNKFLQAMNAFRSLVNEWKRKYLLTAPIDGKTSFVSLVQENQQFKKNDVVCLVDPGNALFYIQAIIPQYNFGKVQVGQQVQLRFDAYPYQEYGDVKGIVSFISAVPAGEGYLAKIRLPDGLVTNYGKKILYRYNLTARAEIITQDKKFLQRIFEDMVQKTKR